MKKIPLSILFHSLSLFATAQFKNVKLADQKDNDLYRSPSIAINKSNPNTIISGLTTKLFVISTDGGVTWKEKTFPLQRPIYSIDYLLSNSKGGMFYFASADTSHAIFSQGSIDEGESWTDNNLIGNSPPANPYSIWAAVHPKKNAMAVTWTQFDKFESNDANCQTNIYFSRSLNGNRWSKQVLISETPGDCLNDDLTAEGSSPTIGTDGKIYVAWANSGSIYFDRSFDDGSTWLSSDLLVYKQEGGWRLDIPKVAKANGLPVLAVNNNETRYRGFLNMVWADQKNGADDTDIWFIRSNNRGDSWSKPVRLNKDSTRTHQFMPSLAVDATTGNVYVVYYDRRNYEDDQTDVYLSYSFDGGNSFSEIKISEQPFTPTSAIPLVDRIHLDAHAGVIAAIWARIDQNSKSIWAAVIKESDLPKPKETAKSKTTSKTK